VATNPELLRGGASAAVAAMDVLLEHWADPRSEKALAEIAERGEWYESEGFVTIWGKAGQRRDQIRVRKVLDKLLAGKTAAQERWQAIRQYWGDNPELMKLHLRAQVHYEYVLMGALIQEAVRAGGVEAVEFLVRAGLACFVPVSDFAEELVICAKRLGRDETLKSKDFVWALTNAARSDKAPDVVPLFEQWLAETQDNEQAGQLVQALINSGKLKTKEELLRMLKDDRPAVVWIATLRLSMDFGDRESLEKIRSAYNRLKGLEISAEEMNQFETKIRALEWRLRDEK
jgi:hypothetical protein